MTGLHDVVREVRAAGAARVWLPVVGRYAARGIGDKSWPVVERPPAFAAGLPLERTPRRSTPPSNPRTASRALRDRGLTPAMNAIHTDTHGLVAGPVEVPTAGETMPAYRAAPAGAGPHPIVLVVPDAAGWGEHVRDVARRLAKRGYFALVPNLFFRQPEGDAPEVAAERLPAGTRVPDERALADLDAAATWARPNGGDLTRLVATGFGWGGRIVWLYAAHQPRLRAGVAWYGRLAGAPGAGQPRQPLDVAGALRAPVLGLYGGRDTTVDAGEVEQMRAALREARSASQVLVYPEAGHGFYADDGPGYQREAADDGWQRLHEWFRQHLRA